MDCRSFKLKMVTLSVAAVLSPLATALSTTVSTTNSHHQDYRHSVKLDTQPNLFVDKSGATELMSGESLAYEFLAQNQAKYALETNFSNLRLSKTQKSLLAEHYYFQQYLNNIPVDNAEIIVSISKQNKITRVYNNTYPVINQPKISKLNRLTETQVTEYVWNNLNVTGELLSLPKTKLVYINLGANFELAYKVNMTVNAPFGDWEFYISANENKVISARRIDLPISKNANEQAVANKWQFTVNKSPAISFEQAVKKFEQSKNSLSNVMQNRVDATGLVFDPDPRTSLNSENLQDNSPAADFNAAYFSRALKDVTLNGGVYRLTGPWITIADFESPATAPSTTTNGSWTAKRGNNAFNDAMTYFHIDQNQRYMQSLGFVGSTGIQFNSIQVDTDGVNGDDNSHFIPGSNQMAFGHGCVDDNEDADVILHEYGHAINHSINPSFSGGDSGAMGEGFGDYWAASYSYSTPNGLTFHPEWAFTWDGHGACWGGRQLDQTSFRYDPTATYGAHANVGGVLGDELWSTPLAQSLLELLNDGVDREDVDQIILEAQFGLSSGLRMPDMATSIVAAANSLFPTGPHAQVLYSHFRTMNILSESLSADDIVVISAGDDTVAEPGETVRFNIPLSNSGGGVISSISTSLSTNESGVVLTAANSNYANINASSSGINQTPFELTIPDNHSCGDDIALNMSVNYTDGGAQSTAFNLALPVGAGNQTTQSSSPGMSIPDNNTTGISNQLTMSGSSANSSISVDMNITHTYRGDLTLTLTSPAGTSVILKNSSNDSAANIVGNYPADLTPAESLSAFDGEDHDGVWTLKVVDGAAQDVGTLNSWGVISSSAVSCNNGSNNAPVALVANANISVDEGNNVSLDGSNSSDADGDTLTYLWTQTSGVTVNISNATSAMASFTAPDVSSTTELVFRLTVTDPSGASDTENVNVTVNSVGSVNNAPVASVASANISVNEGNNVSLNGSNSSDVDGDTLTYLWTQTSGATVSLTNSTSAAASFTAPNVTSDTSLGFQLTVTDTQGATDSASVTVMVKNVDNNDDDDSSSGGGSLNWLSLLLLTMIRRRK